MRKNERGITLIALVVTIVVLIILAGVTITYALSENGIFNKAKDAGNTNELGNARDYMALAKIDAIAEFYSNTAKSWTFEGSTSDPVSSSIKTEILAKNFPGYTFANGTTLAVTADGLTGTVEVTKNGNTYTVDFTNNTVNPK